MDPASPSPVPKGLSLSSRARSIQHGRVKSFAEDQVGPSVLHHMDGDDFIYQRYPSATPRQRVVIAKMITAERADEARKASERETRTKSTVNHTSIAHPARRRAGANHIMAINRARAEKKIAAQESGDAHAQRGISEKLDGGENEDNTATYLDSRFDSSFDENTTEPDLDLPTWNDDKRTNLMDVSANFASVGTANDLLTSGERAVMKNRDLGVSTSNDNPAMILITEEQAGLILLQMHLVDAKLVS